MPSVTDVIAALPPNEFETWFAARVESAWVDFEKKLGFRPQPVTQDHIPPGYEWEFVFGSNEGAVSGVTLDGKEGAYALRLFPGLVPSQALLSLRALLARRQAELTDLIAEAAALERAKEALTHLSGFGAPLFRAGAVDPLPSKPVVFTCDACASTASCEFAFDAYNTNGDCLAEK